MEGGRRAFAILVALVLGSVGAAPAGAAVRDVEQVTIRAGDPAAPGEEATATCGSGETLVGGGAKAIVGDVTGDARLSSSAPVSPRSWTARTWIPGESLRAYVICGRSARTDHIRKIVRRVGPTATVPQDGAKVLNAKCRRGETVIGGGAIGEGPVGSTEDGVAIRASYPVNRRTWRVEGVDANENAPQKLRSFVTCAKDKRRDQVRKVQIREGDPVIGVGTGPIEQFASCEAGQRPIGGGLRTNQGSGAIFASAFDPGHARRWLARSRLNGSGTALVLCAFG